ncbi:DNA polymerase III subunit gamma/tau [Mesomycoplasma neurolyticum]|uniref:DNA polymerase III subunit gamma/tau n=1 Tax=Mesomycoplasma neurolyticum TaxID=2120 RepID=A0A449A538_9BACT|nr:DNA polymerase III subunit gamma/tau [Mesomycoplasma neurolyticum]VEU59381.1 DNA-directed DNA polymerase [Mesomycoplasma neurolyticum]
MSQNSIYKALYRLYRPKTFDEIQGQEFIVETLKNIIKLNKVSHAYLFTGPRGTGKTSIARIFANTLNCDHNDNKLIPCYNCIVNIERSMDIIEMDAASNSGVDDIRELKEKIQNAPSHSKYKIYIIDEIHMLSKSAFNALLKTLEEPPSHSIFILATTDLHKIPLTILSRVQKFNFSKIPNKIILKHLLKILEEQKIEFEYKAIEKIIRLSDGGLRDALSMIEQVSIYTNSNITTEKVDIVFGLASIENLINLVNLMSKFEIYNLFLELEHLVAAGCDISLLANDLITLMKDFLIFNKLKKDLFLEISTKEEVEKLNITTKQAFIIVEELVCFIKDIAFLNNLQQALELSFLKIMNLFENSQIDKIKEINNKNEDENIAKVYETLENFKKNAEENEVFFFDKSNDKFSVNLSEKTIEDNSFNSQKTQINNFDLAQEKNVNIFSENLDNSLHEIDKLLGAAKEIKKTEDQSKVNFIFSNFLTENDAVSETQEKEDTSFLNLKYDFTNENETDLNSLSQTWSLQNKTSENNVDLTNEEKIDKESPLFLYDNSWEKNTIENDLTNDVEANSMLSSDYHKLTQEFFASEIKENKVHISEDEKNIFEDEKTSKQLPLDFSLEITGNTVIQTLPSETSDFTIVDDDIYTVDEIINLFGLNKQNKNHKEIREKRKKEFASTNFYLHDSKFSKYIEWLVSCKFITGNNDFILISADPQENFAIFQINAHKNDVEFKELQQIIFGKEIYVFAITKKLFKLSQDKWKRMVETKTVPDVFEPLKEINQKSIEELKDEKIKSLFGDKFKL